MIQRLEQQQRPLVAVHYMVELVVAAVVDAILVGYYVRLVLVVHMGHMSLVVVHQVGEALTQWVLMAHLV
jgi:hypothetical protein